MTQRPGTLVAATWRAGRVESEKAARMAATALVAALFAVLAIGTPLEARESSPRWNSAEAASTVANGQSGACSGEALSEDAGGQDQQLDGDDGSDCEHGRKPENGQIAVSAVTVVDGAYANFEVATVPKHGGPYDFLTSLPNGAFNPDFSRDGNTILFWAPVDNRPDGIFSVPVEGGALTQIHTDCSSDPNCLGDDNPAVSPDDRELLAVRAMGPFDANGCLAFVGIFKFRADGSHAQQLSPSDAPLCSGDFEPRWSPNGHKIVFQHVDETGLSLWVMRADGSHRHRITPAGMDVGAPDWSPDGDRIVFQSPDEAPDDQTPQQIYTIHTDGTHLAQITHYPPVSGLTIKTNGARWSPDGRKVVFAHLDQTTTVGPDGQHHADLFIMNPDGSDVVQVNFTPEKDNAPAWGPRREARGRPQD